jgi:hypothetical protein
VRLGAHMQPGLSVRRLVRGLDSIIAQHSPLRGYSTHTHSCSALVRQRLGGVGGSAPVHAQRYPAQQTANGAIAARRRACGVGRGVFCKNQSQTNKQTNKQTNSVQRVRRGSCEQMCAGDVQQARCALRVPICDAAAYLEETQQIDV